MKLESLAPKETDICIILAEGLSPEALYLNGRELFPLLIKTLPTCKIAPIVLAQ